jgi:hypothetical protein
LDTQLSKNIRMWCIRRPSPPSPRP